MLTVFRSNSLGKQLDAKANAPQVYHALQAVGVWQRCQGGHGWQKYVTGGMPLKDRHIWSWAFLILFAFWLSWGRSSAACSCHRDNLLYPTAQSNGSNHLVQAIHELKHETASFSQVLATVMKSLPNACEHAFLAQRHEPSLLMGGRLAGCKVQSTTRESISEQWGCEWTLAVCMQVTA